MQLNKIKNVFLLLLMMTIDAQDAYDACIFNLKTVNMTIMMYN